VNTLCERVEQLTRALLEITGASVLLSNDPELAESMFVRNTYLDPLHLLQAELLTRWRHGASGQDAVEQALQVTMAGIASGLRNTG
jgi:phosphoenolpyruvate carboxylase